MAQWFALLSHIFFCQMYCLFSLLSFLFHSHLILSNCFYSLTPMSLLHLVALPSLVLLPTYSKYLREFSESHSAANNTFILSALEPTLCFAFDCLAGLNIYHWRIGFARLILLLAIITVVSFLSANQSLLLGHPS